MTDEPIPLARVIERQQARHRAGQLARALRERMGLTKAQVARSLGCSPTTITHMESGGSDPTRLLEFLNKAQG